MFTPLTDRELRELWELYNYPNNTPGIPPNERITDKSIRRLVLSVVWWTVNGGIHLLKNEEEFYFCSPCRANFHAKLAKIGIEWKEEKDG